MVSSESQPAEESTKIAIHVNGKSKDLSARGEELESVAAIVDKFKKLLGNPYDPDTHPDGIVNLGTAENYIMTEEVAKFAHENAEKLRPEAFDYSYGNGPWGTPRLRKAMARHINRLFNPSLAVDPEQILFANGVTSLCEMLGFAICDEGDSVLLSRPIYQAFKSDFGTKAKVQCVYVDFGDVDQFSLDAVAKYEEALQQAAEKGTRIRALMLCHPHNPLGRCYPVETIIGLMQLCNWYQVHLLVDEIYAMSVYEVADDPKAEKFTSVLSLETDKHISPDYLHLLYGMSKDMACGGLRLGCIYSRNDRLLRAMSGLSPFAWSGNLNEKMATVMLEDEEWMDGFFERSRARLASANVLARGLLDDAGIKYELGSNAGLFLWIDLRPFLTSPTPDPNSENEGHDHALDPWKTEDALTAKLITNRVFITNGKELSASEPGWYRLIFSQDERAVREGIKRITRTVKGG